MIGRKLIIAAALLLCFTWSGCEEENSSPIDSPPGISGSLVKVDGCTTSLLKSAADNNQSCVRFSYDPVTQVLTLQHINAGFNCCPREISAAVVVESGIIRITESESGGMCDCECLYGLHIRVDHIPAQAFTIKFVEPLLNAKDAPIEFTIDLSRVTEGEHCVPRNFYPWGM